MAAISFVQCRPRLGSLLLTSSVWVATAVSIIAWHSRLELTYQCDKVSKGRGVSEYDQALLCYYGNQRYIWHRYSSLHILYFSANERTSTRSDTRNCPNLVSHTSIACTVHFFDPPTSKFRFCCRTAGSTLVLHTINACNCWRATNLARGARSDPSASAYGLQ